jgi:bud site selection protein 20
MLIVNRVKALKEGPYTQKEAEAAIGLRTDNGPKMNAKENVKDVEVEMENSGFLDESVST